MVYYDEYLECWIYDDNVEQYAFYTKQDAEDLKKEMEENR